jgi:hypothetical protein
VKRIVIIILLILALGPNPMVQAHVIADNPASTMETADLMPFTVYPNPLSSNKLVVNVNFNETISPVTFTISNVLGQVVFTYKLSKEDFDKGSFTADLSTLSLDKGIYLMKMTRGDKTAVQKLVVK